MHTAQRRDTALSPVLETDDRGIIDTGIQLLKQYGPVTDKATHHARQLELMLRRETVTNGDEAGPGTEHSMPQSHTDTTENAWNNPTCFNSGIQEIPGNEMFFDGFNPFFWSEFDIYNNAVHGAM